MSEQYTRQTDCDNYVEADEGSWESCSQSCISDPQCIGLQTDNPWTHCEKVYDSHVDDCPDGDFYFYPKQCDDGK